MRPKVSTRLAIVLKSLEDTFERLAELPASPEVHALRARAVECQNEVRAWVRTDPTEVERSETFRRVLDLHVEVLSFRRET